MILAKIASRNLLRYQKKSLAALLSIAAAFVALSLFDGYMNDVSKVYEETFSQRQMLGDVIIERAEAPNPGKASLDENALTTREQSWVEAYLARHQVETRVRFLNMSGIIGSGKHNTVFGGLAYDVADGERLRGLEHGWNTLAGRPLQASASDSSIILGRGLAEILGCELTKKVERATADRPGEFRCPTTTVQLQVNTESLQANAMDYAISGLTAYGFAETDMRLALLSLETAQRLYNTKLISYFTVDIREGVDAGGWSRAFNDAARQAGVAVAATPWPQHPFGTMFLQSMDFLNVFKNFISGIVLIVVIMVVANTFIKIVHERTREIGTMRSIGYRTQQIAVLFCSEALLLAVAGSLLGLGLSMIVAQGINGAGIIYKAGFLSEGVLFRIALDAAQAVWTGGLLCALTIVATLYPIIRVNRRRVSELLAEK